MTRTCDRQRKSASVRGKKSLRSGHDGMHLFPLPLHGHRLGVEAVNCLLKKLTRGSEGGEEKAELPSVSIDRAPPVLRPVAASVSSPRPWGLLGVALSLRACAKSETGVVHEHGGVDEGTRDSHDSPRPSRSGVPVDVAPISQSASQPTSPMPPCYTPPPGKDQLGRWYKA